MYTIKDIAGKLSFNENQVRRRMVMFKDSLQIIHGKHNRILLDEAGLRLLKKIEDLEAQGLSLKAIHELMQSDLTNDEHAGQWVGAADVEQLLRENDRLKHELQDKDVCISALSSVIADYLPEDAANKLAEIQQTST
jgi:DNA-binding transcriptional MerR regulator